MEMQPETASGSSGPAQAIVTAVSQRTATWKATEAFLSVDTRDPAGRSVLEAEDCGAIVLGINEGWELLEQVAQERGLV